MTVGSAGRESGRGRDRDDEDRVTVVLAHETAGVGMFVQTDPVRLTLTDLMELKSIIETRGEPV